MLVFIKSVVMFSYRDGYKGRGEKKNGKTGLLQSIYLKEIYNCCIDAREYLYIE